MILLCRNVSLVVQFCKTLQPLVEILWEVSALDKLENFDANKC
jgi:hypothetical protein